MPVQQNLVLAQQIMVPLLVQQKMVHVSTKMVPVLVQQNMAPGQGNLVLVQQN